MSGRHQTRSWRRGLAGLLVTVALTASGCGLIHPGLSNGAITGCFKALPAAKTAVHDKGARLLGVHRLSADQVPQRLKALQTVPGENDTTVCAVAFKGTFAAGQVTGARPGAAGPYAVVLVDAKKLVVLLSYVGAQLPKALRGRFV